MPTALYSPITAYSWDQFVVPVHKKCHAALDHYSRHIAASILGAYRAPVDEVDRVATNLNANGDYAIAVRLRQCLGYRYSIKRYDEDLLRQNFSFELVCAAGLWFSDS
jgi:hypothetical protein